MSESAIAVAIQFVGRENELQKLHQTLGSVISMRKPRFVLIQGGFGVGKTTLVKQFLVEVTARNPSVLIGEGKCAAGTELNGLVPFRKILISLVEQGIRSRSVLDDFIKNVAPAWADVITTPTLMPDDISVYNESNTGYGAHIDGNVNTAGGDFVGRDKIVYVLGHSTFSQEQIFVQFTNALGRLAEKQPIIAFVEDLHWADASSLRLVSHLARNLEDRAVLFICTYRLVQAMETSVNAALFRDIRANLILEGAIELEVPKSIDVAAYVMQRYPHNTFSTEFVAEVQKRTEGHALFVDQLFSLWQDKSVIISVPGPNEQSVWGLAQDRQIPSVLPPSLSEVLEEQVRLMEDELRESLTCASIEGDDFTVQVIVRLRQLDEIKVYTNLETLERRYRLIQAQASQEVDSTMFDFYRFGHRFFREHMYDRLGPPRRRLLHRQVGECLEALYTNDRHPIAGQLALHFREAHQFLKAANYALMAAHFEQSRYAWAEVEQWCEFGLTLVDNKLPSNPESQHLQLDLLEQSAEGHWIAGNYSQAYVRCQSALKLTQQYENPERMANLYAKLTDIADAESNLEESIHFVTQGKQILAQYTIPLGELSIKLDMLHGMVQTRQGKNSSAIRSLRKVLADVEKLPQSRTLDWIKARAYDWLAVALGTLGNYAEATIAYQKAINIAKSIGEKWLAATSLLNLASNYKEWGKLDECEIRVLEALMIAEQIGDRDNEAYARSMKGAVLSDRGKPQDAIAEYQRAIVIAEQSNAQWSIPSMFAELALTYLTLPDLEVAYQQATRSLAEAEDKGSQVLDLGVAQEALARVEAARQNWTESIQYFTQAIDNYQQAEERLCVAQTQRHFAEALLRQGNGQQKVKAIELLQDALTTFEELELIHEVVETQRLLDITSKLQ